MEESSKSDEEIDVYALGEEKIATGKELLAKLDAFKRIDGVAKIQRKISSEISSLQKVIATKQLKINHILCSNLVHFAYLVHILSQTERVQGVDFPIKTSGNHKSTTRIDIVADGGRTWIKVIARNPKALNDIAFGRSNYGTKSILDHAISYNEGALDNQCCFQNPKIIFDFANPIDAQLEASLSDLGIEVRINGKSTNYNAPTDDDSDIKYLNIDVTTMMAYVSSLTSGSYNWQFNEPLLTEQAIKESTCPIKKFLDEVFEGKELIACESAVSSFLTILETVGGPNEKVRSEKFLPRIKVYPDLSEDQKETLWRFAKLQVGGKIRERTFNVIAFGLYHKALTVTANKGAIEAAKMQGINIPSIVHEARALTEQKESTAKRVDRH